VSRPIFALCLALLLPAAAVAQPIDQDNAGALQHDLQSWFAGLLGPHLGAAEQRLRVTPEDDHFHVVLPFADATGQNTISADVRPLPGGRWSVDALHLPAASRFTLSMPQPGNPPGPPVPTHFDLHIGSQQAHALFDPALSSPSRLDIDLGDVGLETDSARQQQLQHFDRYTLHATLQPEPGQGEPGQPDPGQAVPGQPKSGQPDSGPPAQARPGQPRPRQERLDLVQRGTITGWRTASRVGDKPAIGFGADSIQANCRIDGIDRTHAAALLTAANGMLATLPPAAAAQGGHMALSAPARAALRSLIESLRNIITGVQGEETINGLHIAVAGRGEATVHRVSLGLTGAAPDGMLHATLNVDLDGLTVADLPPAAIALVPRHLALQPSVSGISLAALTTLALAATEQDVNHAQLQADTDALWAQGRTTIGLDALDMDIGSATLHGHGQVRLTGPHEYDARGHITATGLDTLILQAAGNPDLQQALPLLAMARGFARQEGDHLVWDIVANRAGLTVNGVPLGGQPQPERR
jgi:hypothetical protein